MNLVDEQMIFEQQRKSIQSLIFSDKLLLTESPFINSKGIRFEINVEELENNWNVFTDENVTDKDGWQYAEDFCSTKWSKREGSYW